MTPETIMATLGALRQAGSVFGVLFSKGTEEIFSDLAYTPDRVEAMVAVLDDIVAYFDQEGRQPEVLSFCYDGGNLLLMLSREHRLIVLHHNADEADFIAKAAGAFLKDYFTSLAVQDWSEEAGKKKAKKKAKRTRTSRKPSDPTAPITPMPR
ncbi:MAG: hypothetical protein AAGF67_00790 [Verrucomicrobiota bacterium]